MPQNWDASDNNDQCILVNYETDFSIYNTEDYKRCVCFYWSKEGAYDIDCPQEETQCRWTPKQNLTYSKTLEINDETEFIELDLSDVFDQLDFPECRELFGAVATPDYYAIQLIRDNQGQTALDPNFVKEYLNDNDQKLGD